MRKLAMPIRCGKVEWKQYKMPLESRKWKPNPDLCVQESISVSGAGRQIGPKLRGIIPPFYYTHRIFVDHAFGKDTVESVLFCSTMSGTSGKKT